MSDFEDYVRSKGISLMEVTSPFERLLLRMRIISKPVGMLSYPKRSIWFSFVFTTLFLGTIELIFRVCIGISFLNTLPSTELFCVLLLLLSFGPIVGFFSIRQMKKHGDILRAYSAHIK